MVVGVPHKDQSFVCGNPDFCTNTGVIHVLVRTRGNEGEDTFHPMHVYSQDQHGP